MTKTNSELALDAFGDGLSALLAERLEGARLLWIGRDVGLSPILGRVEHALQLDLATRRAAPLASNHTRRAFREGKLRFRPGSFDVIVIPDLWDVPGDLLRLLEDVVEVAEGGLVAFGAPYEGRAAYRELVELADEVMDGVRLFGAVDFVGASFAELGVSEASVVVASSPEPRYPQYILALGGDLRGVPAAFIAERRGAASLLDAETLEDRDDASSARAQDQANELDRAIEAKAESEKAKAEVDKELLALQKRFEAERERADSSRAALEAALDEAKAKIAELASAASERSGAEGELRSLRRALDEAELEIADLREDRAERAILKKRFEARGEEIIELRAELERRRILVRDAVEEMRQLRRRGTGGSEEARRRVLEAEYALEKLRHERDELEASLLEARSEAKTEAPSSDQAELAPLKERAEELEIAIEESERENGKLHDEIAKLAEERAGLNDRIAALTAQVEAQAEDAQATPAGSAATDERGAASSAELRSLIGERDGLQMRLDNTEAALASARARDTSQNGVAERLKAREAELIEIRAKLGSQELALEAQSELMRKLQRDLAAAEKELRDLEAREGQERAEAERLREALMSAIAESDELKASAGDQANDQASREKSAALTREIDELKEELTAQEEDLSEARRRAEAAEEAAERARRSLVEAREALVELKGEGSA